LVVPVWDAEAAVVIADIVASAESAVAAEVRPEAVRPANAADPANVTAAMRVRARECDRKELG
jgi:hypothetical protein